ncbi:MAG: DUF4286 family protein [Bacteroidales bacterium]|nr:DUF4286 family protein [Candidatus Liminaster caballi]
MLIYNTTFHVEESELQKFLCFVKDEYYPAVTRGGHMQNPRLVHLLGDVGEGLYGYAVMAECPGDVLELKKWRLETGNALIAKLSQEFGTKVLSFSTTMKVLKG